MIQRLQSRLRPFACTVLLAALAAVALARAMRADDAGSAPLFGTLTTLLLVAAPAFLGRLRRALDPVTRRLVVVEDAHDRSRTFRLRVVGG